MGERDLEFLKIIRDEFPEYQHKHFLEERTQQHAQLETSDDEDKKWERAIAASYDERIADYFLYGVGDEESLIAQLQRNYELSEQETLDAIDRGIGQLFELTDYGDEA